MSCWVSGEEMEEMLGLPDGSSRPPIYWPSTSLLSEPQIKVETTERDVGAMFGRNEASQQGSKEPSVLKSAAKATRKAPSRPAVSTSAGPEGERDPTWRSRSVQPLRSTSYCVCETRHWFQTLMQTRVWNRDLAPPAGYRNL